MVTPTQSSAAPLADKSSARKPIIIAILTIVLLVGITLSLFFLQIRTAGKAIAVGELGVNQGGILLKEATVEVGETFTIPIKVNLGDKKSVSFEFGFEYGDGLSAEDNSISLEPIKENLFPDDESVVIVEYVTHDSSKHSGTVKVAWLCGDDPDCRNALKGEKTIANIIFTSTKATTSSIRFPYFNVYELGTTEDLVKEGTAAEIRVKEKEAAKVCDKENHQLCADAESCRSAEGLWEDIGKRCYKSCPSGTEQKNQLCVTTKMEVPKAQGVACTFGTTCASGKCINGFCTGLGTCAVDADCQQGYTCQEKICAVPAGAVCDVQHPDLCETMDKCKSAGLNWNVDTALGEAGKCYVTCPGTSVANENKNCVAPSPVCDKSNPSFCKTQPLCSAANNLWHNDQCISETSCPKDAKVGDTLAADGVTKYKTCILTVSGLGQCTKDNLAVCTEVTCPAQGLLWDAVKKTCSVCLVGEELNKEKTACVKVIPKKVSIELEDSKGLTVAKEAKLKKEKHKVKVTIHPDIEFPENHIVLVKVKYEKEALPKTIFADKKPKVSTGGIETAEFSHDIVSGLGTVTIEVAAWNNWPSTTGTFKALLGEVERVTFQIE